MRTDTQLLGVARDFLVGMATFGIGLVVVAFLVTAVWLGIRIRAREPTPPRPEEQPRLPESGPVREVMETRARSPAGAGGSPRTG